MVQPAGPDGLSPYSHVRGRYPKRMEQPVSLRALGRRPGAVKESASEFPSHLRHPPERAAGSDEQLPVGPRRDRRLIPEGETVP